MEFGRARNDILLQAIKSYSGFVSHANLKESQPIPKQHRIPGTFPHSKRADVLIGLMRNCATSKETNLGIAEVKKKDNQKETGQMAEARSNIKQNRTISVTE